MSNLKESPAQKALRKAYESAPPLELPVRNAQGKPIDCEANVVHLLDQDPRWQGVLEFDELAARVNKAMPPPFTDSGTGAWNDLDDTRLAVWAAHQYGVRFKIDTIRRSVALVAAKHPINPVRSFLDGLRWDGKRRLSRVFIDYFNCLEAIPDIEAEDREGFAHQFRYLRLVGVKTFVGMVARAYQPGCKLDTMTVLEGPQGALKSSAWRVLGGDWFTDAYLDPHSKEPMAILQGVWLSEWSELEALGRSEIAAIKRFLSQPVDRFRAWYGTRAESVPRRCVFVGSTNASEYLRDDENRRFWPVRVGQIDLAALRRDREQLFAEAVRWYRRGVRWWVEGPERELFTEQQERRLQIDAFVERIGTWVNAEGENGAGPVRDEVTLAQVLSDALGMPPDRWSMRDQHRAGAALRHLGFVRVRARTRGCQDNHAPKKPRWVWRRRTGDRGTVEGTAK